MTGQPPDLDKLLTAVGNYGCEKSYTDVVELLMEEGRRYVDETPRLLLNLRLMAQELEPKNTLELVKLLSHLESTFGGTPVGSKVKTALFQAKILDTMAILLREPFSNIELLSFHNTVDLYFPQDFTSKSPANEKVYMNVRTLFTRIGESTAALNNFRLTLRTREYPKTQAQLKASIKSLATAAFAFLHTAAKSTITGIGIVDHPMWQEFQSSFAQEHVTEEEQLVEFVKFIRYKQSCSEVMEVPGIEIVDTQL